MELGIYTFVERSPSISAAERMHNLMEEIELADQVGLDVFGTIGHVACAITSSPGVRRRWGTRFCSSSRSSGTIAFCCRAPASFP